MKMEWTPLKDGSYEMVDRLPVFCVRSLAVFSCVALLAVDLAAQTAPRQTRPKSRTIQRSANPPGNARQGTAPQGTARQGTARPRGTQRARVNQARASQPRVMSQPRRVPAVGPIAPAGFPLSQADQARVDQILNYWEKHTAGIKTYQTKFRRTSIDTVFGKETLDVGTIRYTSPDKGLMRVDKVYDVKPAKDGGKKIYAEKKDVEFGEYWVCDGQAIFQFESRTKTLTETQLPPDMRGKSIGEGPLPFMFGAKAQTMQERYWIREEKVPNNPKGDYFLVAIPKRQQDAANFERLLVKLSLSGKSLLPSAMRLYNKQGQIDYQFEDHMSNDPRHRVAGFLNSFVSPKTPRGWTKVVEDWDGQQLNQRQASRKPPQKKNR